MALCLTACERAPGQSECVRDADCSSGLQCLSFDADASDGGCEPTGLKRCAKACTQASDCAGLSTSVCRLQCGTKTECSSP